MKLQILRLFTTGLLLLASSVTVSQNTNTLKKIDSLINVLDETKSVETKSKVYLKLYNLNRKLQPKKALEYLLKHLDATKTIGDSKNIAHAYTQVAWCYIAEVQELDSAKTYLDKALQIGFENKDSIRIGTCYTFTGLMYQRKGYYRNAMENYFKSLDYKIPLKIPDRIGFSYNLIGKTYELQNQYEKSLEFHFKALEERKKNGETNHVAHSYQNIGEVYYKTGDYNTSISYFKKALPIRLKQKSQTHLTVCYNGLG